MELYAGVLVAVAVTVTMKLELYAGVLVAVAVTFDDEDGAVGWCVWL